MTVEAGCPKCKKTEKIEQYWHGVGGSLFPCSEFRIQLCEPCKEIAEIVDRKTFYKELGIEDPKENNE